MGLGMPTLALGSGVTTLSKVADATSTAETITVPASVQAGDLIVLKDSAVAGVSAPSTVVPSGFTSIVNTSVDTTISIRQIVSYKIADGTEGSSSLTGMNGGSFNNKELIVFRGDVPITTVTPSTPNEEATTGDPASQNAAASGGTAPLIVLAGYGSNGSVTTRSFSPAEDAEITAGLKSYTKYKIYNSGPSDTTVDMGDYGTNALQSFYLECT